MSESIPGRTPEEAEKYLEQYRHNNFEMSPGLASREEMQILNRLKEPFGLIDYQPTEQQIQVQRGPVALSLSYRQVDSDLMAELPPTFDDNSQFNWHQVEGLQFSRTDRAGVTIDIDQLLPEGYRIIFEPNIFKRGFRYPDGPQIGGGCNNKYKVIIAITDINSPKGIIYLLHEIGHAVDFARKTEEDKNMAKRMGYQPGEDAKGDAFHIKGERDATAFAINKIRPFIDKETDENKPFLTKKEVLIALKSVLATEYEMIKDGQSRKRALESANIIDFVNMDWGEKTQEDGQETVDIEQGEDSLEVFPDFNIY